MMVAWKAAGMGKQMEMSHEAGLETEGTDKLGHISVKTVFQKYGAEAPTVPTRTVRRG